MENHLRQTDIPPGKPAPENVGISCVGVKSVMKIGTAPVYNMEVDGNHNFTVDGLVVHNCMDETRYFVKTMRVTKPQTDYMPLSQRGIV